MASNKSLVARVATLEAVIEKQNKDHEKALADKDEELQKTKNYLLVAGKCVIQNSYLVSKSQIIHFASILRGVERDCRDHFVAEFATFL